MSYCCTGNPLPTDRLRLFLIVSQQFLYVICTLIPYFEKLSILELTGFSRNDQ